MLHVEMLENHSGIVQTQLSDFRFVIYSGTAPLSEFHKLRDTLLEIEPTFSGKFREDIDPF